MKFEYTAYNRKASDQELLENLKKVAAEREITSLSKDEYSRYGSFDVSTVVRRFGTWNQALAKAGIEVRNQFFDEKDLFDNLEKVWICKGKQPTRRDMDNKSLSAISSGAYLRRYGKWSDALQKFVDYINEESNIENEYLPNIVPNSHTTCREVNLRLRFIQDNDLLVDDVEAIYNYVHSYSGNAPYILEKRADEFREMIKKKLEKEGVIYIHKSAGMFMCKNVEDGYVAP